MGWVASFLWRPNLGKNGIESWLGKKWGAPRFRSCCAYGIIWVCNRPCPEICWFPTTNYLFNIIYFILFLYTSILRRPWAPFCSMKLTGPTVWLGTISFPRFFSQREGHPPPVLGKSFCAFQHSHQLKWVIYPERPVGTSKIIGMTWHGMTCSPKQWKESNTFSFSIMLCYFEDGVMISGLSGLS